MKEGGEKKGKNKSITRYTQQKMNVKGKENADTLIPRKMRMRRKKRQNPSPNKINALENTFIFEKDGRKKTTTFN